MKSQREIKDLVLLSLDILNTMILPAHLFCFDRIKDGKEPRGISVRYTLIVLLGLIRARNAGYKVTLDIDKIWKAALSHAGSVDTSLGDLGLYLWVDSMLAGENTADLLQKLDSLIRNSKCLDSYIGMEIGWLIIGTVSAVKKTGSSHAAKIFKELIQLVQNKYVSSNGLLYHLGKSHWKRRFPNFATQIYNVYSLCCAAEFLGDDVNLTIARKIADRLLDLQLSCGGWPWLYDVKYGSILERYEIYSVHQDGMAPMSLLKLSQLSGEAKYAKAAYMGLDWIYSRNELNFNMIDEKEGLIYRSIRRRKPFDFLLKSTNASLSILRLPNDIAKNCFLEINPTCRPYHLGWILFAWTGQDLGLMPT